MQTLEALRKRIGTTGELRGIVRTMKSLSAVSINQYETAGAAIAEYRRTIELGLQIAEADPNAFVITTAGGELQGYLVTQEGIDKKWYEANNAIFKSPESPERLVEASKQLLEQTG